MRFITSVIKKVLSKGNEDSTIDPILIYQMGKVGSSSIYKSLKQTNFKNHVYHLHLLNNLDAIEKFILETRPNPSESLNAIKIGKELRNKFLSGEFDNLNIITLVRDPIARNISAFFENINEVIPDFNEKLENGQVEINYLKSAFLDNYDHNAPLQWFDTQLRDVFNFDIFNYEFHFERGYSIYQGEKFKLLVIRLEDLNNCIQTAIREFLGIKNFKLTKSNVGQEKITGKIYKNFINNIIFPSDYLDKMYCSKYATHFYTSKEIQQFRIRWSAGNKGGES